MKDKKPEASLIIALAEKDKGSSEEEVAPEVELMKEFESAKDPEEKANILKDFIALCLMRKEEADEESYSEDED
jgi:hypothetical protein